MRHLAVVIAVVCFAAALYSPLWAQTPPTPTPQPTPTSLPDEFGGELLQCEIEENPDPYGDGNVPVQDSSHVTHLCANNHTHSWWNIITPSNPSSFAGVDTYSRSHEHSRKAVSADALVYQPQEIVPGEGFIIDAPVISGPRECTETDSRPSPYKRDQAWDMLNCEVKRRVEMIVAATVGITLLGVTWAGIHIISTPASEGK